MDPLWLIIVPLALAVPVFLGISVWGIYMTCRVNPLFDHRRY